MSTRSFIILKNEDNTYKFNYIHHDGYVTNGVGESLLRNYYSIEHAKELVSIGDRSSLEDETPYDDQDEVVHTTDNISELVKDNFDIEYFYLFDDSKWQVACSHTAFKFVDLASFFILDFLMRYNINIKDVQKLI